MPEAPKIIEPPMPAKAQAAAAKPVPAPAKPASDSDDLWRRASNLKEFYCALQAHSLYRKPSRNIVFPAPGESVADAPYLLVFHSPQELGGEARGLLDRLLRKLGIEPQSCAVAFFIRSNAAAMPRERKVLKEMLQKEIALLNPGRIIFFRERPRGEQAELAPRIGGAPIEFAGKPAITLYSLLEMLPSKEKMLETWNEHLRESGWFAQAFAQSLVRPG